MKKKHKPHKEKNEAVVEQGKGEEAGEGQPENNNEQQEQQYQQAPRAQG